LLQENRLPDVFHIISIGRRDKTNFSYLDEMKEKIIEFARHNFNENTWNIFKQKIEYLRFDFLDDEEGYTGLENKLNN